MQNEINNKSWVKFTIQKEIRANAQQKTEGRKEVAKKKKK